MLTKKIVLEASEAIVEEFDWGQLSWYTGNRVGLSETMTLGRCIIKPGAQNPRHLHPNCEEVLHLISGEIVHSLGDEFFKMQAGDTIAIPANIVHNAHNVGSEEAVMTIVFSTPDRQARGEESESMT
jgi:quercetin dioxygenase-like cupin family protein